MTRKIRIGEGSHARRRIHPGVICQILLHFPSNCAHWDVASTLQCATVNRHRPGRHEGWMVSGQETVFCWLAVH